MKKLGMIVGILLILVTIQGVVAYKASNKLEDKYVLTTSTSISGEKTIIALNGNTFYVDDDGGKDYTCIQDAIDNASSGDTVYVYNGTYYENLIIDNSIDLIGEDKENTIIDGNGMGTIITISVDYVKITGFTIQNSSISEYEEYSGIMSISNYTSITDNIIKNNEYGIAAGIYSVSIISNIVKNNTCGIYLECINSSVVSNIVIENSEYGIYLSSENTTLSDNNIEENRFGIAGHSVGNMIFDNNIKNNLNGISLRVCYDSSIYNNIFFNDGLAISDAENNTVYDNTVNGKPLVYLEGETGVTVDNAGQIILVKCSYITIKDQNLSNTDTGLQLHQTSNSIITNNVVTNNIRGIYLRYNSDNNVISDNIVTHNNADGVQLKHSSNNAISNNILNNNGDDGLHLGDYSHKNAVFDNTIKNNDWGGIFFVDSRENSIFRNNIINNKGYGIASWIFSHLPDNNTIYHNNLIGNTQNSYDEGTNIWYNPSLIEGNYWDNYTGTDTNGDGIGDTPHKIPAGDNQDNYPLMEPYGQPELEIEIKSGFGTGVTVFIRNIGDIEASNIAYSISVKGGILGLIDTFETEVVTIPANDEITVDGYVFGLGKIDIIAMVEEVETKTAEGFVLGPFVTILPI